MDNRDCIKESFAMMQQQKGATIATALLFLLVLSLLLVDGLSSSQTSFKIAAYLEEGDQLFYAAERGLIQAEKILLTSEDKSTCFFHHNEMDYVARPESWWLSSATCSLPNANSTIKYIIEPLEL